MIFVNELIETQTKQLTEMLKNNGTNALASDIDEFARLEIKRNCIGLSGVSANRFNMDSTKNALLRDMFDVNVRNQLKFLYVLIDSWFASQETFEHILKHEKHFIAALKSNRLVALSLEDKKQGRFVHVNELDLSDKRAVRGYLKGFDRKVLLVSPHL